MRFHVRVPRSLTIPLLAMPLSPVSPVPGHDLLAQPSAAEAPVVAAEKFEIDPAHSALEFVVRFMGLSRVRGRFAEFRGTILYDAERPEGSTVSLVVPVASIDTDNDFRDRHLKSPDWFDAEGHPTMTFQSRRIEAKGGDRFVVHGPLTIRGVTREVQIPLVRLHAEALDAWGNRRVGFEGELTVDRTDWGIEGTNFFNRAFDIARMGVAHEVRIELVVSGVVQNMERVDFWSTEEGEEPAGARVAEVLEAAGIESAIAEYRRLREAEADRYDVGEAQLNVLGYKLLQAGRVEEAVRIFELNAEIHPDSANVHDSLGQAYVALGDEDRARASYARALALDPISTSAIEMLRWLEGRRNEVTLGS